MPLIRAVSNGPAAIGGAEGTAGRSPRSGYPGRLAIERRGGCCPTVLRAGSRAGRTAWRKGSSCDAPRGTTFLAVVATLARPCWAARPATGGNRSRGRRCGGGSGRIGARTCRRRGARPPVVGQAQPSPWSGRITRGRSWRDRRGRRAPSGRRAGRAAPGERQALAKCTGVAAAWRTTRPLARSTSRRVARLWSAVRSR